MACLIWNTGSHTAFQSQSYLMFQASCWYSSHYNYFSDKEEKLYEKQQEKYIQLQRYASLNVFSEILHSTFTDILTSRT